MAQRWPWRSRQPQKPQGRHDEKKSKDITVAKDIVEAAKRFLSGCSSCSERPQNPKSCYVQQVGRVTEWLVGFACDLKLTPATSSTKGFCLQSLGLGEWGAGIASGNPTTEIGKAHMRSWHKST